MALVWLRNTLRVSVILSLALLNAACPVPFKSGYSATSRQNLSAEVAQQLTVGVSTREDVLALLGEADDAGPNDSWLTYGSAYGRGGVIFVVFGGSSAGGVGMEKMEYRRLVVTFDERGVVSDAEFVSQGCWEGLIGTDKGGGRSAPCVDSKPRGGNK